MVTKYSRIILALPKRFIHKYLLRMDKAYFRNIDENDQFHFTFRYQNSNLKVDRQFNLIRQISEPVSTFLTRLGCNVEKIITKKCKKKNSSDVDLPTAMNVQLLVNGVPVPEDTPCREVFHSENSVILNILNHPFKVIIDSPWVDNISLPSSILATYPVYPAKLELYNSDINRSEFIWYMSKDKRSWIENSRCFIFSPPSESVGSFLKLQCIPKNAITEGPAVEVESKNSVDASPGLCPFEVRHLFTKERAPKDQFRVVTYNILADLYCSLEYTREVLHPYCPPYALEIDYRKQLILKELVGYNADIICLQEVDRKVFKHDLQPVFSYNGFEGDFAIKGGDVAEGEAVFYYTDKFTKLKSSRIVFSEHIDKDPLYSKIWDKIGANEKLVTRILELKTTLQTVLLQSKNNENELLFIANTHLYFHPDADHIRVLQAGCAITYIQHHLELLRQEFSGKRISLIFCGDFNSVPSCGVYKLFTTGFVPEDFIDYRSNQEEVVKNLKLEQNIPLGSACGTPKYTNFTSGFADCLDYIYYEKQNLDVHSVVPMPSNEELAANTALPSIVFPSDHIALISDLKWL